MAPQAYQNTTSQPGPHFHTKKPLHPGWSLTWRAVQMRFTKHAALPLVQCLVLTINNSTGDVSRLQVITCLSVMANSERSPLSPFRIL